jgi:hypothetical protein
MGKREALQTVVRRIETMTKVETANLCHYCTAKAVTTVQDETPSGKIITRQALRVCAACAKWHSEKQSKVDAR